MSSFVWNVINTSFVIILLFKALFNNFRQKKKLISAYHRRLARGEGVMSWWVCQSHCFCLSKSPPPPDKNPECLDQYILLNFSSKVFVLVYLSSTIHLHINLDIFSEKMLLFYISSPCYHFCINMRSSTLLYCIRI